MLADLHEVLGWVAIAVNGLVGLSGVGLAIVRAEPPPVLWWGVATAIVTMLTQVGLGVYLLAGAGLEPGDQHLFYGVVVAFVFAFAYIYRSQLRRRPALSYGLFHLFVMGLAIRAIQTFDIDF